MKSAGLILAEILKSIANSLSKEITLALNARQNNRRDQMQTSVRSVSEKQSICIAMSAWLRGVLEVLGTLCLMEGFVSD